MESNPGDSNERPQQPEESKNEQLRKIKVKTIDNQVFSLEVPPSILIGEFKKELEKKANVPADRQRLIYMAKVLHDEQPLNTIVNEDDQTIHLLAKTQSAAPTGPQTQPQAQGQSQPQGQPSQQNDPNAQNRANLGPAGAFFRVGGLPDLGGIINGLIGNVSGLGSGGAFGPGMVNLGAQPGQPGQNPQGQNQAPTGPQQGQPGPQVQANPLGGNASIMGLNFAISASTDPNDPNRVLVNQPQVRVISSGPLDPSALLGQQQQQQQQGQPQGNVPVPNILGGLLGQGAQPGVQGAGPGGRTVIELPHRHVFNIGSIVNSLMGQNTAFPGPPMPQLGFPRNSLALLGGYLYNYQFQMMRLMPFLSRLADLLQRESLITNPNERHQVELLAHAVGHALDEVAQATTPVVHLFRNVQVGTSPGDFRIRPSQQQQQQAGPQPSAVPLPNLQSGSPLNIARVFGGLNPQFQQRAQNEAQNQPGSQPSGVGAQARPQEQGSREDRMEIVDETEQFFNRGQQRPQPEPTQQRQEQQQQQAPRAGAAPQTQPQGQGNIMGGMLGQMMGMGPGLMDQTLGSFFGDREMETEDDEHIMSILGLLTVGDFFALLTAGNASCFDRIHFNMRDVIRKMLDKNGGSKEALAKSWAKTISKYFEPEEQHRNRVMEGFEPHTVAEEISTKHFIGIIDSILKDYLPPHKFSDAFVNDFKIYIRELISEISEGLYDGMNDFELILKERFKNEVSNMAPGMEGLVMSMVWPQLWQKILRLYQQEASANQAGVTEPERELDDVEREEALLKEIAEVLREDNEMEPPPGQPAFSEAYMKGDMNYEEKK